MNIGPEIWVLVSCKAILVNNSTLRYICGSAAPMEGDYRTCSSFMLRENSICQEQAGLGLILSVFTEVFGYLYS